MDSLFNELDRNKDGVLSRAEFETAHPGNMNAYQRWTHVQGTVNNDDHGGGDSQSDQPSVRATNLLGRKVENPQGQDLGAIKDLLVDVRDGRVRYAVLDYARGPGTAKLFSIPIRAVHAGRDNRNLVVDIDGSRLAKAPGFPADEWRDLNAAYTNQVDRYYGSTNCALGNGWGGNGNVEGSSTNAGAGNETVSESNTRNANGAGTGDNARNANHGNTNERGSLRRASRLIGRERDERRLVGQRGFRCIGQRIGLGQRIDCGQRLGIERLRRVFGVEGFLGAERVERIVFGVERRPTVVHVADEQREQRREQRRAGAVGKPGVRPARHEPQRQVESQRAPAGPGRGGAVRRAGQERQRLDLARRIPPRAAASGGTERRDDAALAAIQTRAAGWSEQPAVFVR